MHLWDRLLPQAILTLSMLRTSRINPKISAATHLDRQYEYNRAPMAPPGTIIIAHETPNHRLTWAPAGQDGWYIGPALEHYRCYRVYINKTRSEIVVETVVFSTEVKLPLSSSKDLATEVAKKMTYALVNPQPASPFTQVGDEQGTALNKLAAIFEGALPKHIQQTATPLIANDNSSPQRVDITESPQREQQPASAPRVVVPTTPNKMTPNSHRILQTMSRRFLNPTTPHHMVRMSAGPLNLSQDMLEETVQQEIHVFSLPIRPSDTPVVLKPTKIEQIISMPEMTNEAICSDTCKLLKHSELITFLR
jgi:hypothetical protein